METEKTDFQKHIESGKPVLLAELSPPRGADPAPLRAAAGLFAGKVHAVGINDNRDGVRMSALAAASHVLAEGVEPILHITTRDRNRIALASDCLGAQALGVRNLLCATGTHQTLGPFRRARNVFDIDPIQMLEMIEGLARDASLLGEDRIDGAGPFCLGAKASPYEDPMGLQVIRLAKAVAAGAKFIITQPVYDIERFEFWWAEATRRGLHEKVAVIAGIRLLANADFARTCAARRPDPKIPAALLERITAPGDRKGQRDVGVEIALETVQRLSGLKGLRGFEVRVDEDTDLAVEFLERSGLEIDQEWKSAQRA
ncbi:MAG: methylenetetrahydrofolate reductase [Deltaproteobacteria bacterium]|nr:methylenetetrahydrofolate reductase [Deltaproteobacteria bacterium]